MAIHPVAFRPAQGEIDVWHDERGHGGTLQIANLAFGDNDTNESLVRVPCPVAGCGSESTHPVGGGSHPRAVQVLHLLKQMQAKGRTFAQAKALIKARAEAMDGPGRDQLGDVTKVGDI